VVRFSELDHWATHGEYERILGGDYPRRDNDASASVGEEAAERGQGLPGLVGTGPRTR
jgi:hypothetical protein